MGSGFSSLHRPNLNESKTVARSTPSSLPPDVWLDVLADLSRDQLDTASISCDIFWTIIVQRFTNRCLRDLEKVHIRSYDTGSYPVIADIVPAQGSLKHTGHDDDIVKFLLTRLKHCYVETFRVEYAHGLPALIPELAYHLYKSVHVGELHLSGSRLHELPSLASLAFFNRLASIAAVRFDDALDVEQLSNELLAICSKKGVKDLRSVVTYPSPGTSWSPLHKLNEDGIIAFLFGDPELTTPKSLAVGCVALGPHFINRLVEIHKSTGVRANISLDVILPAYRFDVTRWKRNLKSVPPQGGAVFDFPGPMRLQVAVIDDLLRIRRGSAENVYSFFYPC